MYEGDLYKKNYYITDVTPLIIHEKLSGFVVIYKDITQLKKSMQQLQDSQTRMMEQERMAFLGQMMGGLAHNLKTPIMSISGCVSAAEDLVEECSGSLGDAEVTPVITGKSTAKGRMVPAHPGCNGVYVGYHHRDQRAGGHGQPFRIPPRSPSANWWNAPGC